MAGITRQIIQTTKAPAAIGAYSQAVRAGQTLYISGQIGLDPDSGNMVPGGVAKEAEQVMKNMGHILEAAGASYKNVVKTTVLLKNINDFAVVNTEYAKHFSESLPARAAFAVADLPKGALVEIEAIALLDS